MKEISKKLKTFFLLLLLYLWYLPRKLLIGAIVFYQKTLSPDHSFWAKTLYPHGYCKFQPTCSEYMKTALHKHGFWKGSFKGFWRILKCNPWTQGGEDYC